MSVVTNACTGKLTAREYRGYAFRHHKGAFCSTDSFNCPCEAAALQQTRLPFGGAAHVGVTFVKRCLTGVAL